MPSRQGLDLERGERLHYRGSLRKSDAIAVTEDRLLVAESDQHTSVPYTNVEEVNHESFDWFLGVMSVALAAFGLYSIPERPLLGTGFALAGVWSLYRTYRHRDRIRIHTHSQSKPIDVFPEDVDALYDELEAAIEAVRESEESDDGSADPGDQS